MADENANEPAKKGKAKLIILLSLVGLLVIGGSVGATLFFTGALGGGGEEHAAEGHGDDAHAEPHYFAIEPPITVNFKKGGGARFLQVSLQVMTHDPAAIEQLQIHMPVVRNNLNMLFSNQTYEELSTREGKELLRAQVTAEIQNILTARAGTTGIEDVYFTSFVMQ